MNRVLTFFKRADLYRNRIIIPKIFIDKYGRDLYMELYDDKIIIYPKNKNKE